MRRNDIVDQYWVVDHRAAWTGKAMVLDDASEIPRTIIALDHLVDDIRRSKRDPFSVSKSRFGWQVVKPTALGTRVIEAVHRYSPCLVRSLLPGHRLSPYFEVWEWYSQALHDVMYGGCVPVPLVEPANRLVQLIRLKARDSTFQKIVRRQERAAEKNVKSVERYLTDVFRYGASRLLVVRVDLTYPSNPGLVYANPEVTDVRVKHDMATQIRFFQRQLDNLIGYVWKIEYGLCRGYHCHVLLLFDGHYRREGITLGKLVGDHWLEVTHGDGTYWNCNANISHYTRFGLRGIGLINYDQHEERRNLIRVGSYLAKSDYYARFVSPTIRRTFGKGQLDRSKSARGRPRSHYDAMAGAERSDPA